MLKKCRTPECKTMIEVPFTIASLEIECRKCKEASRKKMESASSERKMPTLRPDEELVVSFLKDEEAKFQKGVGSPVIKEVGDSYVFISLLTTLDNALMQGEIELGHSPLQIISALVKKGVLVRIRHNRALATYRWGYRGDD